MNETLDCMSYNLVIKKEDNDMIDPIYLLLDWLYSGCTSEQTFNDEDRAMHALLLTIQS